MNDGQIRFVDAAKGLARNPLGIIALFIVLVYGLASLVTAFAGSFSHEERLPLGTILKQCDMGHSTVAKAFFRVLPDDLIARVLGLADRSASISRARCRRMRIG